MTVVFNRFSFHDLRPEFGLGIPCPHPNRQGTTRLPPTRSAAGCGLHLLPLGE
jgi:hypothetical protein